MFFSHPGDFLLEDQDDLDVCSDSECTSSVRLWDVKAPTNRHIECMNVNPEQDTEGPYPVMRMEVAFSSLSRPMKKGEKGTGRLKYAQMCIAWMGSRSIRLSLECGLILLP